MLVSRWETFSGVDSWMGHWDEWAHSSKKYERILSVSRRLVNQDPGVMSARKYNGGSRMSNLCSNCRDPRRLHLLSESVEDD